MGQDCRGDAFAQKDTIRLRIQEQLRKTLSGVVLQFTGSKENNVALWRADLIRYRIKAKCSGSLDTGASP